MRGTPAPAMSWILTGSTVPVSYTHLLPAGPLQLYVPVREPYGRHQAELYYRAKDVVGNRHTQHKDGYPYHMENRGYPGCRQDTVQLAEAGEAPHAVVQIEKPEDYQRKDGIEWGKLKKCVQVLHRYGGVGQIEPQKKTGKIGAVYHDNVIDHQVYSYGLPVFPFPFSHLCILIVHDIPIYV